MKTEEKFIQTLKTLNNDFAALDEKFEKEKAQIISWITSQDEKMQITFVNNLYDLVNRDKKELNEMSIYENNKLKLLISDILFNCDINQEKLGRK